MYSLYAKCRPTLLCCSLSVSILAYLCLSLVCFMTCYAISLVSHLRRAKVGLWWAVILGYTTVHVNFVSWNRMGVCSWESEGRGSSRSRENSKTVCPVNKRRIPVCCNSCPPSPLFFMSRSCLWFCQSSTDCFSTWRKHAAKRLWWLSVSNKSNYQT